MLPDILKGLRVPVIGAPMFIVSTPALVIAQCKAGIVGSFPALNAREAEGEPPLLEAWLEEITTALAEHDRQNPDRKAAPFAVNLIVHRTNPRLERDVEICKKWKVPIWITSLGAREDVNVEARSVGALTFHDIISDRFAHKAIEKGASGLIAVAAGAGGHAGTVSPLALIGEIRRWFDGPLFLSGAIGNGASILAALAAGADAAYIGSAFIATREANAPAPYKDMIVASSAEDIVYSNNFTGVWGNYLKPSIAAAGLDPDALPVLEPGTMNWAGGGKVKAWRDIWGSGQGIGSIRDVVSVEEMVAGFEREYHAAFARLSALV